jgi:hypothetical protein
LRRINTQDARVLHISYTQLIATLEDIAQAMFQRRIKNLCDCTAHSRIITKRNTSMCKPVCARLAGVVSTPAHSTS